MKPNSLLILELCVILVFVHAVKSGRFPIGKKNFLPGGRDVVPVDFENEYNSVGGSNGNSFDRDSSDNEYYEFETGDDRLPDYVTDEQINEVQKAQEKVVQDQQAYLFDRRCPNFDGICSAPNCSSDNECGEKICCYNGCVHTCAEKRPIPSIVVDWIPFGQEKAISFISSIIQTSNDTITIPGGCKMTHEQSDSLDLFIKYGHVTKCVCVRGDVLCYLRQKGSSVDDQNISYI